MSNYKNQSLNPSRVIVWAVPRAASTVFAKSITARNDLKFYFEPYSTAEHCGPDGRIRIKHAYLDEQDYTAEAVKDWLEEENKSESSVFVKDHAYAVHGRYHVIPEGYKHTFLIRKPESVFKSFYRVFRPGEGFDGDQFQDWLPKDDNVFKCVYDLAEYVELTLKGDICILDSDDIATNPAVMIERYCSKVGFHYSKELLQWEPGVPDGWVIAPTILKMQRDYNWIGTAITSTGWGVGVKRMDSTKKDFPEEILAMIDEATPYYEQLRAHPSFIHL